MKRNKKHRRKGKKGGADNKGKHDLKCEEQNRKGRSSDVPAETICYYFPQEIMEEIFHRLPVKALVKFTAVCKAWNSFIRDHTFISSHLNRTIPASNRDGSIFFQLWLTPNEHFAGVEFGSWYSHNHNQLPNHFSLLRSPLDDRYQSSYNSTVVGTCYGLVCSVYDSYAYHSISHSTDILIWNPSIQKYLSLPCPIVRPVTFLPENIGRWLCFGFGFDSRTQDYKVVRLVTFYNEPYAPHHFVGHNDVYVLGTPQVGVYSLAARSWRSISVRVPEMVIPEYLGQIHQVFVYNAVHWVVSRIYDGQFHNFILLFDMVEEIFGELPLPPHLREDPGTISVLGGGDLLAVRHIYRKSDSTSHNRAAEVFCIWVMEIYGVAESWTEVFHCDSESYGGVLDVLAFTGSGKVVLRLLSGAIVLIDPMTDLVKPLGYREYSDAFVGPYVESLFLINKEPDVLSF